MYKKYTNKLGIRNSVYHKIWLIMRLTTVILIATLMQVSASTLAQKITLSEKNSSLEQVLAKIKIQTGYDFVAGSLLLKEARLVNIQVQDAELPKVLEQIFRNQSLQFEIQDKIVVIRSKDPSYLDKIMARFQAIDIRGKILDEKAEPLVGATIAIKGSGKSVKTNAKGEFYLQNVDEKSKLVISYIGYQTIEVNATADLGSLTMVLADAKLEEVMINAGYYTVKDSERTGSISRITSKDIEKQPVTNVLATMQGRMAGVSIVQSTGVPGGAFKIEIRGQNSMRKEGNAPLYIIDGMPYPSQQLERLTGTLYMMQGPNPMEGINPADIESIEVLKDADATSIYGSRGANGVVLISTKKGKAGKTAYDLNAYTGVGKVASRLELMNTQQYVEMRKEAFANDGLSTSSFEYENAYDLNGTWDPNRYTDWQKEMIGGTSATYNVQLGISGGSQQTQFLVNGGHSRETTVFPGDFGYKKSSAHLNLNHSAADGKFKMSFSGNYVVTKNDQPFADLTYYGLVLAPNAPALYKENGELNWAPGFDNPLAPLLVTYLNKSNTLTTGGTIGYKLLPGLEIKSAFGFVDVRMEESKTSPHTSFNPAFGFDSSSSSYTLNNGYNQSWNIEPQVSWEKRIGRGQFSILAGATFQQAHLKMLNHSAYNFTSNSLIQNLGAAKTIGIDTRETDYRYNALFLRLNYNLQEKYLFNITARRDGSSRFGPGKRFGSFGAAGLAWLFGKEKFIAEAIPFLSFGKLRSSYGTTGSDQIGDYQFLDTYTTVSENYQGIIGLKPTRLFNADFSWETNKKLEFAIDLGFLKDRIFFTAAYFRNRSSNQLVGMPLPGMTGFTTLNANLNATVQNTGLELELKTTNLDAGDLHWTSTLNFTLPRNKLVSFPDFESSTYASDYIIGQSLATRKLYNSTGVDPQTGLYTFRDYNNDGKITYPDDNKKYVDLTTGGFGGIGNHISYRNLEVDFVLQLEKRNGINTAVAWSNIPGNIGSQSVNVLKRWQKSGDITSVQRYTAGYEGEALNTAYLYQSSDAAYADASYIRLKTFSIAYHLKPSWLKAANCRIYLQGQNLFTITNYEGLDPETQWMFSLPPLKVFTAGIKLNY
jgi:TonB-linked SusC/RagA family outer membrane protein